MRGLPLRGLLALSVLAAAGPVHAQRSPRGWIGISYEVRPARADGSRPVVITDVVRWSPAGGAGIRAGDRLVAINDLTSADGLQDLPTRLSLRAGQEVTIRLEREGRRMDLRLRATERPPALLDVAAIGGSAQGDSMTESMFRAMDSLRTQVLRAHGLLRGDNRRVAGATSPEERAPGRVEAELRREREAVSAPFEFFVFRGERHDSLLGEMDELNRALAQLRRQETERISELQRLGSSLGANERDRALVQIRGALEELTGRSASLSAAMADAARATAGMDYLLRPAAEPGEERWQGFRPLTPYLLGSNRVAGAQVVALQPELGAYFGVDDGVLIVDVAPGTPAAIAGMRPGDVVTRLDQVGVRSVEELRFGVAQAGDTLPVTLIRQRASLQVLLRRR